MHAVRYLRLGCAVLWMVMASAPDATPSLPEEEGTVVRIREMRRWREEGCVRRR
jgi:hypothetical protein